MITLSGKNIKFLNGQGKKTANYSQDFIFLGGPPHKPSRAIRYSPRPAARSANACRVLPCRTARISFTCPAVLRAAAAVPAASVPGISFHFGSPASGIHAQLLRVCNAEVFPQLNTLQM